MFAFRCGDAMSAQIREYQESNGMPTSAEAIRALVAIGLRLGVRPTSGGRGRGARGTAADVAASREARGETVCAALGGAVGTDEGGNRVCRYETYAELAGGQVDVASMSVPLAQLNDDDALTQFRDIMGAPVSDQGHRDEITRKANRQR